LYKLLLQHLHPYSNKLQNMTGESVCLWGVGWG
jgi:hypothetical protein